MQKITQSFEPKSVAILITTYKRHEQLKRLLHNVSLEVANTESHITYTICIADSEAEGSLASTLGAHMYTTNSGEGFDQNLLSFFETHSSKFDYILMIGDDDLLNFLQKPLQLLDAIIVGNPDAILFNHNDFALLQSGDSICIGQRYYNETDLLNFHYQPFRALCSPLPRYTGLIYKVEFLHSIIGRLAKYRGTLHLYAAPALIAAAEGTFRYCDFPLTLFRVSDKVDGAWVNQEEVYLGLLRFLNVLLDDVDEKYAETASIGFYESYFKRRGKVQLNIENELFFSDIETFLKSLESNTIRARAARLLGYSK